MINIGFDARMITHPGIGRYMQNLFTVWRNNINGVKLKLYGNPDELRPFSPLEICAYNASLYSWQELASKTFNDQSLDLVHIPHFNAPLGKPKRLVVTIHDLIYLKFPQSSSFLRHVAFKPLLAHVLKRADRIIAVSENTKQDIIKFCPTASEKIEVIYEAADPMFRKIEDTTYLEQMRQKLNLPKEFILFVGSIRSHKNIERLLEAYCRLQALGIKHRLVLVGRPNPRESYLLEKIKATDAMFLAQASPQDLVALYNLATVLVLPSVYEGFGLPVLEAMACGVPVAVSSVASLPEIASKAAVYFDPFDSKDIQAALCRICSDEGLRKRLIQEGFARNSQFSWDKAAAQTLRVYQSIYESA
ncbi:MAG: glycosyltransferase family 4 protein [Candidatus Omnitrophica bacterium]|nr:glycosyltransferase family 4 protein [Candidatus Omnitrophota bacterium]